MTPSEIREIEHWAHLMPFNNDLYVPYRAPNKLRSMIDYIYRHPTLPSTQRKLYIDVSQSGSRGLINDMAVISIAMMRYFINNQSQFGGSIENVQFQILKRMWKQTFNHMWKQGKAKEDETNYLCLKLKVLSIDNGLWDELIRVVQEEDYYQTSDDMIKNKDVYNKKSNKASLKEGSKHFEYLCNLE